MSEKGEGLGESRRQIDTTKIFYEDPDGNRVNLTEGIPFTYKWFSSGSEFHTSPWGADMSPFAGETTGKVRLAMLGEKMRVSRNNNIASVRGIITAVEAESDRALIGRGGWFRLEDLSKEEKVKSNRSRRSKI